MRLSNGDVGTTGTWHSGTVLVLHPASFLLFQAAGLPDHHVKL